MTRYLWELHSCFPHVLFFVLSRYHHARAVLAAHECPISAVQKVKELEEGPTDVPSTRTTAKRD